MHIDPLHIDPMHIRIDHATCIGSGQCVLTAPGLFAQDDDGYSTLLPEGAAATPPGQAREAALSCPVGAIEVREQTPR